MLWPSWEGGYGDAFMWTLLPLGHALSLGAVPTASTLAISGSLYPKLWEPLRTIRHVCSFERNDSYKDATIVNPLPRCAPSACYAAVHLCQPSDVSQERSWRGAVELDHLMGLPRPQLSLSAISAREGVLRVLFAHRRSTKGRNLLNVAALVADCADGARLPWTDGARVRWALRCREEALGAMRLVDQLQLLRASDVFVSMHGADVINGMHLLPGRAVLEVVNHGFHVQSRSDGPPFYFLQCFRRHLTPTMVHKRLVLPNPYLNHAPDFMDAWNKDGELPPELFTRALRSVISRDGVHTLHAAPLNASARTLNGYCDTTPSHPGDCTRGQKGSWGKTRDLAACVAACHQCERCHFVSFSSFDCSWFRSCNLERLEWDQFNGHRFTTVQVRGSDDDSSLQGAREVARSYNRSGHRRHAGQGRRLTFSRPPSMEAPPRLSRERSAAIAPRETLAAEVHRGHCGITSEADGMGDCIGGFKGVLDPSARTLEQCVAACADVRRCPRCSWVSFTREYGGDCSWYAHCDGPHITPHGHAHSSVRVRSPALLPEQEESVAIGDRTLVILVHHASSRRSSMGVRGSSSGMAVDNVRFFVRYGITPALSNPRYTFVIANSGTEPLQVPLPRHPRVSVRELNGSHGFEFINYKRFFCGDGASTARRCAPPPEFRYFVLLPDTVRGPLLPNYVSESSWPDLLTHALSSSQGPGPIKLVGPSINCMYCHRSLRECRDGLHVQGFMLATDRVGLATLLRHWRRPSSKGDSIAHNEVAVTPKLLSAGYNVAVLQRFWRGHDFRDYALTQRKCALLTSRAKVGTFGANTSLGLVTCPGCQWGDADLAPLEVLFAHRSMTENFEAGPVLGYTQMGVELEQLQATNVTS